jgi:hypothetical protein
VSLSILPIAKMRFCMATGALSPLYLQFSFARWPYTSTSR